MKTKIVIENMFDLRQIFSKTRRVGDESPSIDNDSCIQISLDVLSEPIDLVTTSSVELGFTMTSRDFLEDILTLGLGDIKVKIK